MYTFAISDVEIDMSINRVTKIKRRVLYNITDQWK